jgi:DNA (cytosine-5)-methyltransferase 1
LRKLEDQVETKPATKKLNPDWVCCLMGLPAGWVNQGDESSNRTDELRLLGNGVVPQTAAKAIQTLALLLAK